MANQVRQIQPGRFVNDSDVDDPSAKFPPSSARPELPKVYTPKAAATADWLSNGRLDFGVGVGWLAEEFEALQVPFEHRGTRTREYLEVIRRLWCEPLSEFEGEFYTLPPCRSYPKPVQSPHPPIFFGGESEAALRRVADLGQGWYGFNLEPEEVEPHTRHLDELLSNNGRSLDEVEIVISPYLRRPTRDLVQSYRDDGVDQIVLMMPGRDITLMTDAIRRIADDYVG